MNNFPAKCALYFVLQIWFLSLTVTSNSEAISKRLVLSFHLKVWFEIIIKYIFCNKVLKQVLSYTISISYNARVLSGQCRDNQII